MQHGNIFQSATYWRLLGRARGNARIAGASNQRIGKGTGVSRDRYYGGVESADGNDKPAENKFQSTLNFNKS